MRPAESRLLSMNPIDVGLHFVVTSWLSVKEFTV